MDLAFVPVELSPEESNLFMRRLKTFQWNSKIVLTARFGTGLLGVDVPVMIKSISFQGKLRVQIKLMSNEPFVKVVEISFREQPKIDFILKPLKSLDLMDMPGLSHALQGMINDTLSSMLVNPNSMSFNIDEMMNKKAAEGENAGILKIDVYRYMPSANEDDYGNMYVKIELAGRLIGTTRAIDGKISPYWNECYFLIMSSLKETITFSVFDSRDLGKDKLVGMASYPLSELDFDKSNRNVWTSVSKPDSKTRRGEMNIGVNFFPIITRPFDTIPTADDGSTPISPAVALPQTGILRLYLHQAKDIIAKGSSSSKVYSPFAEIFLTQTTDFKAFGTRSKEFRKGTSSGLAGTLSGSLGRSLDLAGSATSLNNLPPASFYYRTKTKKRTNSPNWEEYVEIFVSDKDIETLMVQISDQRDLGGPATLGQVTVPIRELINNRDSSNDWYEMANAASGKVRMTYTYDPVDLDIDIDEIPFQPSIGILQMKIFEGRDFPDSDLMGRVSYYFRFTIGGVLLERSPNVACSSSPVWNSYHHFFLNNATDPLIVDLYRTNVIGKDTLISSSTLDLTKIESEPNWTEEVWLPLMSRSETTVGELNYEISFHPYVPLDVKAQADTFNAGILCADISEISNIFTASTSAQLVIEYEFDDGKAVYRSKPSPYVNGSAKWDDRIELLVSDDMKNVLKISVRDSHTDSDGNNIPVARYAIPIRDLLQAPIEGVIDLAKTETNEGKMKLKLEYKPAQLYVEPESKAEDPGTIDITFVKATDLVAADSAGTSDPFIQLCLNGKRIFKSKVIRKNCNPAWNESFSFPILNRHTALLNMEVLDWNRLESSESIGSVNFATSQLLNDRVEDLDLKLEGVAKGSLQVKIVFRPDVTNDSKNALVSGLDTASQGIQAGFGAVGKGVTTGLGMTGHATLSAIKAPISFAKATKKLFGGHSNSKDDRSDSGSRKQSPVPSVTPKTSPAIAAAPILTQSGSIVDSESQDPTEPLTDSLANLPNSMSANIKKTSSFSVSTEDQIISLRIAEAIIASPDPNEKLDLVVSIRSNKKQIFKTKAIKSNEPDWNESIQIPFSALLSDLTLDVREHHFLSKDTLLKRFKIPSDIALKAKTELPVDVWLTTNDDNGALTEDDSMKEFMSGWENVKLRIVIDKIEDGLTASSSSISLAELKKERRKSSIFHRK